LIPFTLDSPNMTPVKKAIAQPVARRGRDTSVLVAMEGGGGTDVELRH
jgi:hypothetical protein